MVESRRESSKLMAGFGAVTPWTQPEDFGKVRAAFEQAVTEEVIQETAQKQGHKKGEEA